MKLAKRTTVIRVDDEFKEVCDRISQENGIGITDATRVIARRLKQQPGKLTWNII